MIWLLFLIPTALIVVLAVGYDYFKRKSFKEVVNNNEVNMNAENARRDANTWNSNNNYGP